MFTVYGAPLAKHVQSVRDAECIMENRIHALADALTEAERKTEHEFRRANALESQVVERERRIAALEADLDALTISRNQWRADAERFELERDEARRPCADPPLPDCQRRKP